MAIKKARLFWTKDELKQVIGLWDEFTLAELAEKLGRETYQVASIARQIRKAGYTLTQKRKGGQRLMLIKEVLSELTGKKNKK